MSLPSINFLHLTVSEIQPGQTFSHRRPAHPDTMGENNTPTALKGCEVKCIRSHRKTTNLLNFTHFIHIFSFYFTYLSFSLPFIYIKLKICGSFINSMVIRCRHEEYLAISAHEIFVVVTSPPRISA